MHFQTLASAAMALSTAHSWRRLVLCSLRLTFRGATRRTSETMSSSGPHAAAGVRHRRGRASAAKLSPQVGCRHVVTASELPK